MMVHHMATICLLYFSWVVNFPRIGTLVMLVHDAADVPLAVSCMFLVLEQSNIDKPIVYW